MASRVGFMLVGDWAKADKMLKATPKQMGIAIDRALWQEGHMYAAAIKQKILSNIPPPNALSTRHDKGSSKTLIAKGDMLAAVAPTKSAKGKVYVGIGRSAKRGTVKLARVHEEGRVIVQHMTEKQRRFLHAKFAKMGGSGKPGGGAGGSGIIVIHIPARPFIRPVFEELKDGAEERFLQRVSNELDKLLRAAGGTS